MATFVLAYRGGSMALTEAEQQQQMAAWGAWFGQLGPAVADAGTPFAGSTAVSAAGEVSDGGQARLTGYSILAADSLAAATELAKTCPLLSNGGTVDVYETVDMPTTE